MCAKSLLDSPAIRFRVDALDPGFVHESRILCALLCDLGDLCGEYPAPQSR
jgi:hypothetical protein